MSSEMRRYLKTSEEFVASCAGKTCVQVQGMFIGSEEVAMTFSDRTRLVLFHRQDCCESFVLEDVAGDPRDLLMTELVVSEMVTTRPEGAPEAAPSDFGDDSFTDTWVKFRTHKGDMTLRFRGESNGYYSESCDAYVDELKPVSSLSNEEQVEWDMLLLSGGKIDGK